MPYLNQIWQLGGVGRGVNAENARVPVGVVVGRGAVHPVVPIQHMRIQPDHINAAVNYNDKIPVGIEKIMNIKFFKKFHFASLVWRI